ncbi:amidohydrolase family protein [Bacillus sp. FJAT-29814]|uniref:amidohydrolase family protein n=1 Tax=Bacillus sp. FJAT-29814 TaxID=1729688 RepID=UPI0009E685CE|nr:amidohydrolase family protein [Bacillus sp. FJAT-29814]
MMMKYIIRGKKIVTVSKVGTIMDGAMAVADEKIKAVGPWAELRKLFSDFEVMDCSQYVITPALVDCHTHLLEFAPTSLFPVTPETHFIAGRAILFHALSCGITALGEQICGHPLCDFSIGDYRKIAQELPMDLSFATTSISVGFEKLAHFSAVTKSRSIEQKELTNPLIVRNIAEASDYPGENVFINATPANFTADEVPRAGEVVYTLEELKSIVLVYHQLGKRIGCHVAGEEAIDMALDAGFDVLHHAHGITNEQIERAARSGVHIVATPMGGTHLRPNSPEEIVKFLEKNIPVSISTDAYLPPYQDVPWLPFQDQSLRGPAELMLISQPAMLAFKNQGYDENKILALLTDYPAAILGKADRFGRLEPGLEANFLVAEGVPGLEVIEAEKIKMVFYRGLKVIERQ